MKNFKEIKEAIETLKSQNEDLSYEIMNLADEIEGSSRYDDVASCLQDAWDECDNTANKLTNAIDALEAIEWKYTTTYAKALDKYQMVLCNKIAEIEPTLLENCYKGDIINMREIMQYYLTGLQDSDVDYLTENYENVYFAYSKILDLWVLLVDHFGTSWEYVEIGTNNEYDAIE